MKTRSPLAAPRMGTEPKKLGLVGCFFALVALLAPETARADWLKLDDVVRLAKGQALSAVRAEGEVAVAEAGMRGAKLPIVGNPYLDLQVDRGSSTKDVQALGYLYLPLEVNGVRGARIDENRSLVAFKQGQREEAFALVTGEAVAAYGELAVAGARVSENTF
ncbi:MAG: hypothetical protein JNM74_23930, partial [Myxococcales bacterium]|nr:hypothetical protein [Myxococcales bacterium]